MSTVVTTPAAAAAAPMANKRMQLEALIREFQTKLGANWDTYHEALTMFLIGRLTRTELVRIISPMLKNGLIKYHNKLLLLNFANSLQEGPAEFSSELAAFWNKKNAKSKNVKSSQYEKFKQNIMSLPLKERRRIRAITRESGKRNKLNASITLTRHALLPKIPMIQDKEQQQLQVNNMVQWQQDVLNGINTPLATKTFELPDYDTLSRRVLMTMRENGLTGGVNAQVLLVISLGLEAYLKNIFENAIDIARYRENKYASNAFLKAGLANGTLKSNGSSKSLELSNGSYEGLNLRKRKHAEVEEKPKRNVVLNIEDMYNTLEMFPHLVEPGGPRMRLSNVMLQNDDMIDEEDLGYTLPPKVVTEEKPILLANGTIKDLDKKSENIDTKNEDSQQLKAESGGSNNTAQQNQLQLSQGDTSHIGTVDELKWVLHDLISTT